MESGRGKNRYKPYVPRKRKSISDEEFKATLDLGYRQPTQNMKGGVGIPGGRKSEDVKGFSPFDFARIGEETGGILQMSKKIRKTRDSTGIEEIREDVQKVNRRVEFEPRQVGLHSLHVGNDIAAVWNSATDKSKVYDYPDLASRLDQRLETLSRNGKSYGESKGTLDERRQHVAAGIQHFISGDPVKGLKAFDDAGLNNRGKKWAFKMTNILMSERGRELAGGKEGSKVFEALGHVGGVGDSAKSFADVFVKNASALAPFAQRGGAKTFK